RARRLARVGTASGPVRASTAVVESGLGLTLLQGKTGEARPVLALSGTGLVRRRDRLRSRPWLGVLSPRRRQHRPAGRPDSMPRISGQAVWDGPAGGVLAAPSPMR